MYYVVADEPKYYAKTQVTKHASTKVWEITIDKSAYFQRLIPLESIHYCSTVKYA